MKCFLLLTCLCTSLLSSVQAYSVAGGSVSLNKETVLKIDPKSQDIHRVSLNSVKDVVSLSVDVKAKAHPHQLMFLLSNDQGLDHAVYASFKDGKVNGVVSVNKLPGALKKTERIFVSVIAADKNVKEENVNFKFLELVPSEVLKESVQHESATRLGPKAEIHHIFKTEAATVNPVVPIVFSAIAIALFVVLLGGWGAALGSDLFRASSGSLYKTALLATLGYFEFNFFRYYLGASIFTTIFQSVCLAGPFLFFASRSLTALGRQRSDRKA